MNLKHIALVGMLAGCTATFATAQDSGNFSAKDKTYLKDSAQSDMAEMNMAQLALQKSSNDDIKGYANQMLTDHKSTSDSAKPIAEKAGVPMPADVNPMQKSQYTRLSALSGTQFDKEYVKDNVLDHKTILQKGKQESASTQNSDMKSLTSTQEPIITDHYQKAQALAGKMGGKGSSSPSGM